MHQPDLFERHNLPRSIHTASHLAASDIDIAGPISQRASLAPLLERHNPFGQGCPNETSHPNSHRDEHHPG